MPVLTIAWLGVPMTEQRYRNCCSCNTQRQARFINDAGVCDYCRLSKITVAPNPIFPDYEASGLDEFHGPTSHWVDPSPPVLSLFEEDK